MHNKASILYKNSLYILISHSSQSKPVKFRLHAPLANHCLKHIQNGDIIMITHCKLE